MHRRKGSYFCAEVVTAHDLSKRTSKEDDILVSSLELLDNCIVRLNCATCTYDWPVVLHVDATTAIDLASSQSPSDIINNSIYYHVSRMVLSHSLEPAHQRHWLIIVCFMYARQDHRTIMLLQIAIGPCNMYHSNMKELHVYVYSPKLVHTHNRWSITRAGIIN
jgi:hypothetical protein